MIPWWDKWKGRLEWELEALTSGGIAYKVVEKNERTGALELSLACDVSGEKIRLTAKFPSSYPFVRFELYASELQLEHHQNPYSKVLCVIGRATSNWRSDDNLAAFLSERLPAVLVAGRARDQSAVAGMEEHQGEPASTYLPYQPNSIVFVPEDSSALAGISRGRFQARIAINSRLLRGSIDAISGNGSAIRSDLNSARLGLPSDYEGRWFRLPKLPPGLMPLEFYEYANKVHPELGRASYKQLDDGSRFELIGFLVPDELAWRSVGESWVFLARRQITRRGFRTPIITTGFVRAGRIGRQEMEKRIPELIGLKSQTVAVVGLGCVGAPSVVELARAGLGGVKIMDPDIVEAGTTVRWPFGLQAAGIPKTEFLANFIATNYPYTEVQGWTCRMGGIPGEGGATQEEYEQFCNHTNLIMDASAEIGINELLSEIAREKKIPYVGLSSTFGGWGGRVIVLRPELSACYHCLMHHIEDKTIPLPPESPHGLIQVAGCSDPTFTAAGFDTSEISLSAVRCVVSVLCAGAEGAYPKIEGDVFILRLRNENGTSCLPHWEAYKLARHPKCQNH